MLAGMLLAMLFRIDEYAAHHGHRAAQQALTA
jgi:hypothetical protein